MSDCKEHISRRLFWFMLGDWLAELEVSCVPAWVLPGGDWGGSSAPLTNQIATKNGLKYTECTIVVIGPFPFIIKLDLIC